MQYKNKTESPLFADKYTFMEIRDQSLLICAIISNRNVMNVARACEIVTETRIWQFIITIII